ncbi:MAG: Crp/Fnr family transcriptional regulator [Aquisalinus sp.]|nr:Crp/Fnr family transcriptional regulator [Aquisalinus sp.]
MSQLNDSLKYELKKNVFFSAYSDQELEDLFSLARTVTFKSRKEIFGQGDQGDSMFILLSGRVKISTFSTTGKETVLSFLGPGDILGEIALLDEGPRTAAAHVLEETRALQLHRKDFLPFIEKHPRIALQIISVLCQRLRRTDMFVEEVVTMQAAPRLARALIRLADSHGKEEEGGNIRIHLKLSQGNLGAHAGLMRENVNRQLKIWEEGGILSNENGMIILHDIAMLEEVIAEAAS